MLSHSKKLITAFGLAALASAGWMAGDMTARADNLPLAGAPLVCAKGFAAKGDQQSYSCKSEVFKCGAGFQLLFPSLNGNRASYICAKPEQ
jgi:hypothetical protein